MTIISSFDIVSGGPERLGAGVVERIVSFCLFWGEAPCFYGLGPATMR